MIRSLFVCSVLVLGASCAGRQDRSAATPAAARRADAPTVIGPAVAPEADPENVERRFGFAEARARREKAAADTAAHAGHAGHGSVGVVTDGKTSPPEPAGGHDQGAAATPSPSPAKPGEHQHGAGDQAAAAGKPMCPCMAGHAKDAAPAN